MTTSVTADDLKAYVVAKAGEDAAFRASLLASPRAAVEKLLQTDLPAHVQVQVMEEAPDTYVVVLPAPQAADGELTDADLEGVAGGAKSGRGTLDSLQASSTFGAGLSLAVQAVGQIAHATGDKQTAGKAQGAARTIYTCGVE